VDAGLVCFLRCSYGARHGRNCSFVKHPLDILKRAPDRLAIRETRLNEINIAATSSTFWRYPVDRSSIIEPVRRGRQRSRDMGANESPRTRNQSYSRERHSCLSSYSNIFKSHFPHVGRLINVRLGRQSRTSSNTIRSISRREWIPFRHKNIMSRPTCGKWDLNMLE